MVTRAIIMSALAMSMISRFEPKAFPMSPKTEETDEELVDEVEPEMDVVLTPCIDAEVVRFVEEPLDFSERYIGIDVANLDELT